MIGKGVAEPGKPGENPPMSNSDTQQIKWTAWGGGRCPVLDTCLVTVGLRYAGERTGKAKEFLWSHDQYNAYGAEDVVRYRVHD